MKRWKDGKTDGRTDGQTDGPTDGRMKGWVDGKQIFRLLVMKITECSTSKLRQVTIY